MCQAGRAARQVPWVLLSEKALQILAFSACTLTVSTCILAFFNVYGLVPISLADIFVRILGILVRVINIPLQPATGDDDDDDDDDRLVGQALEANTYESQNGQAIARSESLLD